MLRVISVLAGAVLVAGSGLSPVGTALAAPPAGTSLAVYGESIVDEPEGTEQYLHVLAIESEDGVGIGADGYTMGPVTCADGSVAAGFLYITGSAQSAMEVSGPLDHASVVARMDLTTEVLAGCEGTVGQTTVLPDRPVRLEVDQSGPPLRVRSTARVRVPGQRNDMVVQRVDLHPAAGQLTIDTVTRPTSSAGIERDSTVTHGSPMVAAVPGWSPFFTDLAAQVTRDRSTVLQARGGLREQAETVPPPGGLFDRYVDVIIETVDRAATTGYAVQITDTVTICADGSLGLLTEQRYGDGPGTLTVGPRFSTAQGSASVPLGLLTVNGCDGTTTQSDLGTAAVELDLTGTAPVLTATDARQFVSPPVVRGHERMTITGRGAVAGTVRLADLLIEPTEGGIGELRAVTQQVGPGE